ncbi:uncharacterized protein LOC118181021 [Stegodyphus dumicola]|uniref:uncharacterized protein LOC118181021 n=1 Tax=Stegodyphus dumicola TaxID=202533 RepID=UPI0015AD0A60|nr:uncharacterized protein LOC118181021 [Stegodyphus dumicola]
MTLGEITDDKRDIPRFIYIQDLPESASHKDIRKVFGHFQIPEGGIFINGQHAFVSLETGEDVAIGLFKSQRMFQGKMIHYTSVRRDEMEKIIIRNVKRVLKFPLPNYSGRDYKAEVDYLLKLKIHSCRRIRPTAVCKVKAGSSEPNSIFRPKETVVPQDGCAKNQQETAVGKTVSRKFRKLRRIHPTPVVEVDEKELERIFVVGETEHKAIEKDETE